MYIKYTYTQTGAQIEASQRTDGFYSTVWSNTNQQTISITRTLADHEHPAESTCSSDQVIKRSRTKAYGVAIINRLLQILRLFCRI